MQFGLMGMMAVQGQEVDQSGANTLLKFGDLKCVDLTNANPELYGR